MINPKVDILWRVYLLYALMLVFGIAILSKIVYIQVKEKDELLEYARKHELKYNEVKAMRGNIFSRTGTLLATSVPVFDIYFDPVAVVDSLFNNNVNALSDSLSRMFKDKTKFQYTSMLRKAKDKRNRYLRIAKKVSLRDYKRMTTFPIFEKGQNKGGFIAQKNYIREIPYDELAKRTIGYVNETENLYVGLEGAFNEYLRGKNGRQMMRHISSGFWTPVSSPENVDPQNGRDIYTSIDIDIQDVAEDALKRCLIENDALQGCVIMMDVHSGFVEVMASLKYNEKKNKYQESYNFAIAENVEPGSTFKAVTMCALLENNPNFNINDSLILGKTGAKKFHNRTMRDSHVISKGRTTIKQAFEESSNIGMATLAVNAFENKPEKFIENIYKTSINKPLNLDIKGEGKPYIKSPSDKTWSKVSLPWMSIGYELSLTPIQILTFYNAIANDGVMVKPQFVKEIRRGKEVEKVFDTIVINESIASSRTISTLQKLLKGVVEEGTAKMLNKCPFPIAGKTGTAQISQGKDGYNKKNYTASFVGYFPADDPKYSCIVIVSNPRGDKYYGGSVSAPVFKEIAEKVYATRLGITEENKKYTVLCDEYQKASMIYYDDAIDYCNSMNVSYIDDEIGSDWIKMRPYNSEKIKLEAIELDSTLVPDVQGMNVTDAVCLLESLGWKTSFAGRGKVNEQSVKVNTVLEKGNTINLVLK